MPWIQLSVDVSDAKAEALSDALMEVGALSVSIEDAASGTSMEQAIFGEPGEEASQLWPQSRVVALFEENCDAKLMLAIAAGQIGLPALPEFQLQNLAEQDWVRLTQAQFEPIRVSQRLWITPSWHVAPDPSAINLQLDPGLAFGTGSHPTTRLCLEYIEQNIQGFEQVLDYGCGSGILAIAAAKLGAASVCGTDIDAQAIQASRDNAAQNGVSCAFFLPDQLPAGRFDLLLANILANPLRLLVELLANKVKIGGRIVLSGILAEQAEELSYIYSEYFDMDTPVFDNGWTRLSGIRCDKP